MERRTWATIFQEGGKLLSALLRDFPLIRHTPALPKTAPVMVENKSAPTNDETVRYQKREIGKELLLLEKHLQQGCKIEGKPCDCCEKHPIAIEGLVQETLGMIKDPSLSKLVEWTRSVGPITTQASSASGEYDKKYPELAVEARQFRKAIMGTDSPMALISKEDSDEEGNQGDNPA